MVTVGGEWPLLETLCVDRKMAGNKIPDAWIATAVTDCHLHLVTFDAGFRSLLRPSLFTLLET